MPETPVNTDAVREFTRDLTEYPVGSRQYVSARWLDRSVPDAEITEAEPGAELTLTPELLMLRTRRNLSAGEVPLWAAGYRRDQVVVCRLRDPAPRPDRATVAIRQIARGLTPLDHPRYTFRTTTTEAFDLYDVHIRPQPLTLPMSDHAPES